MNSVVSLIRAEQTSLMFKLLGSLLTIGSCCMAGVAISFAKNRRIHMLEELEKMTVLLSAQIRYGNTTIPEAFLSISHHLKEPLQTFFARLAELMEEKDAGSLKKLFNQEVDQVLSRSALTKEDLEGLKSFGGRLGYLDKEQTQENIRYYQEQLRMFRGQLKAVYLQERKAYCALGIGTGVLFVILLY